MHPSGVSHRRANVVRICALALVRLWFWTLIIGVTALLLGAWGKGA